MDKATLEEEYVLPIVDSIKSLSESLQELTRRVHEIMDRVDELESEPVRQIWLGAELDDEEIE